MSVIADVLKKHEAGIVDDWVREMSGSTRREDLISKSELRDQCTSFVRLLRDATSKNEHVDLEGKIFQPVRDMLADVSRSRALQGFTPSETATFVFSFKRAMFPRLREEIGKDADKLAGETWTATELLDRLGLFTTEVYQKSREEVIKRQQQEMLELSTPVVKLWEGILALPLIGTLDSARTQVVMESLLQEIVRTGSQIAIIDITGVPTVDTLVAQHLLKTVTAARLMGAECIISGIRPQIAQTIVHLGGGLGDVLTKATLADAFRVALQRTGAAITNNASVS